MTRESLTGWGGTCPTTAEVVTTDRVEDRLWSAADTTVIARGLGRSYGDAAQNAGGRVVRLREPSSRVTVDRGQSTVTVNAGMSLATLLGDLVPQGWFLPVVPGTANVTVGGAIAADVHGKNHPDTGGFGAHVRSLTVHTPAGEHRLSPREDSPTEGPADWFWATVGGMGLTGIITSATLEVIPITTSLMHTMTTLTRSLDQTLHTLATSPDPYGVAWIDGTARGSTLGRGVVTTGSHAGMDDRLAEAGQRLQFSAGPRLTVPRLPYPQIRPGVARAFNRLWRWRATPGASLEPLSQFFFPLDAVNRWNRLYGRAGMVQWQVAIPDGHEDVLADAMGALFTLTDPPACLVTLKRLGDQGLGHLSFPLRGWTLAVDLPARGTALRQTLQELDTTVAAVGGRVYLAKDSRVQREHIHAMYPRLGEWQRIQTQMDPDRTLRSDLSQRLGLLAGPISRSAVPPAGHE